MSVDGLDAALGALADPTRRAMVERLVRGPGQPSELADELGISRPNASRHLAVLRRAGLVAVELDPEDQRRRRVRLKREALGPLRDWLDELNAFWVEQLEHFAMFAEADHDEP